MSKKKFNNQDYTSLRRALLRDHQKFVDPTFPPSAASVNLAFNASDIEWHRPTELVSDPRLVVNGIRGSDVMQGERGNPWFVTASAALTARPTLLNRVMPNYGAQDYGPEFHPGIFQFVFSRHGTLFEVVIDDNLPTRKGRLVYAQSCDPNEFWSALLEKAYAKLHGDYASLRQGRVVDAVASFVRGIPDHWETRQLRAEVDLTSVEEQRRLATEFKMHMARQSLLLFSLQPDNKTTRMGDWTKDGLVHGRGYLLNEIQHVTLKDGKTGVTLLKLQNAWFDLEWTGPWSDNSPEWKSMSLEFRDKVNYEAKRDGIFWMNLSDALQQFTDLDICVMIDGGAPWLVFTFHGDWSRSHRPEESPTAGGSYEYSDTYPANPQYLLTVPGENSATVSFCLEQGNPTTACHAGAQLEIGLDTFSVEQNRKCRIKEQPRESWTEQRVQPSRQPSVLLRAKLHPGAYLIVPCTKEPNQEQSFTLRAFSQSKFSIHCLPEFLPRSEGCCSGCQWNEKAVTRLLVTKVAGVNSHLKSKDMLVSIRVDSEAADVANCQSFFCHEDKLEPDVYHVNFKVLLYRHQMIDPIEVEVFCQSPDTLTKQFLGTAGVLDKDCETETTKEIPLYRNSKELSVKLFCTVQCSRDLDYF